MMHWRGVRALCLALGAWAFLDLGAVTVEAGATPHPRAAAKGGDEAPATPEVVDRIVATIDGEPITLFELQAFSQEMHKRGGADVPASDRAMLDELVLEKILHKQIEAQGVAASDQQVDAYIASIKERNKLDDAQLKQALAAQGLTWEAYRAQVKTDIERAALINKEIRNKVNVPPEEVERYYKEHIADYGAPGKVQVRLISILLPPGASEEQKADPQREGREPPQGGGRRQGLRDARQGVLAGTRRRRRGRHRRGDERHAAAGVRQGGLRAEARRGEPRSSPPTPASTSSSSRSSPARRHQSLAEVSDDIQEKLYRENMENRYDRWLKEDLRAKYNVEILL